MPFLIFAVLFQRGVKGFGFARRHALTIMRVGGGLLISSRKITLDQNVLVAKNVSIFF